MVIRENGLVTLFCCYRRKKKLNDAKKKKKESEYRPVLQTMSVHKFMPHSPSCSVCSSFDFHSLCAIGEAAGFVPTLAEQCLTLSKVSSDGRYILCYAKVYGNGKCKVVVGCRDVTNVYVNEEDAVSSLIDTLLTKKVCTGNRGFEELIESRRENEIIVVFRDSNNAEVSREEPEHVLRHVTCRGFVDVGDGDTCSKCTNYRSSLRKSRNLQKESSGEPPSAFTRHDRLSGEQKSQKIRQLTNDKKTLQTQLKVSEARLSKLIATEGVEVAEDISMDTCS